MVFFIFIQILKENSVIKQWRSDQTPQNMASYLVLHCLPMFNKKNTRLKWVNILCIVIAISHRRSVVKCTTLKNDIIYKYLHLPLPSFIRGTFIEQLSSFAEEEICLHEVMKTVGGAKILNEA